MICATNSQSRTAFRMDFNTLCKRKVIKLVNIKSPKIEEGARREGGKHDEKLKFFRIFVMISDYIHHIHTFYE